MKYLLNVYTDSEINVEQVESEISAAAESRTFFHAVGHLLLIAQMHAKHAERDIEAYIVEDEHAEAGAEIKRHLGEVGLRVAQFPVVGTFESRRSAAKRKACFIEHRKTF